MMAGPRRGLGKIRRAGTGISSADDISFFPCCCSSLSLLNIYTLAAKEDSAASKMGLGLWSSVENGHIRITAC